MHCNVCHRTETTVLPFYCAACARNVLYQSRLSLAHTLLEQEAAVGQSDQHLGSPLSLNLDSTNIQSEAIRHQTLLTLNHAQQLQRRVDDLGHQIARGKTEIQERTNEVLAARKELTHRRAVELGRLEKNIAGIHGRWDAMHARTAESRSLLCREAMSLYGLKKRSIRAAPSASETYYIGGLPIYNLRELNSADPAVVMAVTASLAHLVHLVSHYLALRLPAEIILPHHDCPYPLILTPESSYTTKITPNSLTTPDRKSSKAMPVDRDILHANQRSSLKSVHAKEKLSVIAKEDPQAYAAIVEGITLLAWNVAWLCRIQGCDLGMNSWDNVCDVGKNLWKLFTADPAGLPSDTDAEKRVITKQDGRPETAFGRSQLQSQPSSSVAFGQLSHGTVHSNLSTASGSKVVHGWRFQDPIKIVARIKQELSSERTGAGWELLEGKEWESQMIRSQQPPPNAVVDASTVVTADKSGTKESIGSPSLDPKNPVIDDAQDRVKGTSGWTILKSR
ncbi:MAG: hypothetical protein Q9168_006362 [Polycauliona sp. 1 TL-2023]